MVLGNRAFTASVSRSVPCNCNAVVRILHDVSQYPTWWPMRTRVIRLDRTTLLVTPVPLVTIGMEQVSTAAGGVTFQYVRGPFRGIGTWHTDPLPNSVDGCLVTYDVALWPANRLAAAIAKLPGFLRKHQRDISAIMARLTKQACRDETGAPADRKEIG